MIAIKMYKKYTKQTKNTFKYSYLQKKEKLKIFN